MNNCVISSPPTVPTQTPSTTPTSTNRPTTPVTNRPPAQQESLPCPQEIGLSSLPSREKCDEYYICFNGNPKLVKCDMGFHFNAVRGICDLKVNSRCSVSKICKFREFWQISTTVFIQINNPIELPTCDVGLVKVVPHPSNCNWYFLCYNGNRFIQQCPTSQRFDAKELQCVARADAVCADQNWSNLKYIRVDFHLITIKIDFS